MTKLVRDNIFPKDTDPKILRPASTEAEFKTYVLLKLMEEAEEVYTAGVRHRFHKTIETNELRGELGDLLDVVDLICETFQIPMFDVIASRILKNQARGGFKKRLIWSGGPSDPPSLKYRIE
jgi:predicted house-cleaning noncanonical NTP pyrophosphatase (MazG superfamily)